MKLLKSFIIVVSAFVLISCSGKGGFSVNVSLDNAEGKKIYLHKVAAAGTEVVDSALVKNGLAVLKSHSDNEYVMYGINCKGWRRPLMFFADNKDVTIKGDFLKQYEINIVASESQARLKAFEDTFNQYDSMMEDVSDRLATAQKQVNPNEDTIAQLESELKKLTDDQSYFLFDNVWENNADYISHYILYRYKWAMRPCELRHVRNNFDTTVFSPYLTLLDTYISKLDKVEVGMPFTDFAMTDTNGNETKLSDVVGKNELLIVDFWASWCPDCRKENPYVVSLYNEFHDKGLDILSVSLDTDRDRWLAGIEADGLIWENHVSDLKGWSNVASDMYAVVAIPDNVIIDKNGIIVARNLHGDDLRFFVENALN